MVNRFIDGLPDWVRSAIALFAVSSAVYLMAETITTSKMQQLRVERAELYVSKAEYEKRSGELMALIQEAKTCTESMRARIETLERQAAVVQEQLSEHRRATEKK